MKSGAELEDILHLPDGVSKILCSNANSGSCHTQQGRSSVVEFEHPVVDVNLVELEPAGQVMHQMSHLAGLVSLSFVKVNMFLC